MMMMTSLDDRDYVTVTLTDSKNVTVNEWNKLSADCVHSSRVRPPNMS